MQQSRQDDPLLTSLLSDQSYTSDITTGCFVLISLPFIAILDLEVSLAMVPFDLLSELLALLTMLLAQTQVSDGLHRNTELSIHETTSILGRSGQIPLGLDLAEIARGRTSLRLKIPPLPSFLLPLDSPMNQPTALSGALTEIRSPLATLCSELESSVSSQESLTISALCSSILRSVCLARHCPNNLTNRLFFSDLASLEDAKKTSEDLLTSSLLFALRRRQVGMNAPPLVMPSGRETSLGPGPHHRRCSHQPLRGPYHQIYLTREAAHCCLSSFSESQLLLFENARVHR
jgi:hypothetical protein